MRRHGGHGLAALLNFAERPLTGSLPVDAGKPWRKRLDSAAPRWRGPGATLPETLPAAGDLPVPSRSFALYLLEP